MITGLQDTKQLRSGRLQRGCSQYEAVYSKLNDFIEVVNDKIGGRIQLVQQVYLADYKQQVTIMSNQLKKIRAIMDEQLIKQRSNQRLFFLEEERDFFRAQVMKLNGDLERVLADNNKLKTQVTEKKEEIESYRKITYGLETKIFKMRNESAEAQKLNYINETLSIKEQDMTATHRYGKEDEYTRNSPSLNRTTRIKPSRSVKNHTKATFYKEENTQRQEVIDECIKEVKKQIYYRNLNLSETSKIHFNEANRIPFSRFTKTDKKELIFKLLSNPKVLEDFYDYLFDKRSPHEKPERLTKLTDSKFNTMTLLKIKSEFNKKIYDLKANT